MGRVIVVSGKGGVGKTTVAALLIKHLTAKNKYSILAIDADPDTNLPDVLAFVMRDATIYFVSRMVEWIGIN